MSTPSTEPVPSNPAAANANLQADLQAELAWGERVLRGLLLGLLALVGMTVLIALQRGEAEIAVREFAWWVASAVLMWNVWRGSVWSWRIAVALSFVAGFLQLVLGLFVDGWLGWLFAVRGLMFLVVGLYLVADGPVRRALEYRWGGRTNKMQVNRTEGKEL